LADCSLDRNKFLKGIVSQYGRDAVRAAAEAALGYPAVMVSSAPEAIQIQTYIENERK
jgi:hypothetical protein